MTREIVIVVALLYPRAVVCVAVPTDWSLFIALENISNESLLVRS